MDTGGGGKRGSEELRASAAILYVRLKASGGWGMGGKDLSEGGDVEGSEMHIPQLAWGLVGLASLSRPFFGALSFNI